MRPPRVFQLLHQYEEAHSSAQHVRLMFDPDGKRPRIADWDQVAPTAGGFKVWRHLRPIREAAGIAR
jgi:hypothetical protein